MSLRIYLITSIKNYSTLDIFQGIEIRPAYLAKATKFLYNLLPVPVHMPVPVLNCVNFIPYVFY